MAGEGSDPTQQATGESSPYAPPVVYSPGAAPDRPRKRWWILLVIFGILLLGGCSVLFSNVVRSLGHATEDATAVGERVLGAFRDGAYTTVWEQGSPEFQEALPREKLLSLLTTVEQHVGKPKSWKSTGFRTQAFTGTGATVMSTTFTYQVTHERGSTVATIRVDNKRRLLYLYFNISP